MPCLDSTLRFVSMLPRWSACSGQGQDDKAQMLNRVYTPHDQFMYRTQSLLQVAAISFLITAAAGWISSADRRLEKKSILASVFCFLF